MSVKENYLHEKNIHDFCTLSLEVFVMRIIMKTILNFKTGEPIHSHGGAGFAKGGLVLKL